MWKQRWSLNLLVSLLKEFVPVDSVVVGKPVRQGECQDEGDDDNHQDTNSRNCHTQEQPFLVGEDKGRSWTCRLLNYIPDQILEQEVPGKSGQRGTDGGWQGQPLQVPPVSSKVWVQQSLRFAILIFVSLFTYNNIWRKENPATKFDPTLIGEPRCWAEHGSILSFIPGDIHDLLEMVSFLK